MKTVKVLDKEFGLYIPQEKIEASIQNVADQINLDMEGMNPMFLVVLNGAFMFASELFKRLTIPCEISFVKLTSYSGTCHSRADWPRPLVGRPPCGHHGRHRRHGPHHALHYQEAPRPESRRRTCCHAVLQTQLVPIRLPHRLQRHGHWQRVHRGLRVGL